MKCTEIKSPKRSESALSLLHIIIFFFFNNYLVDFSKTSRRIVLKFEDMKIYIYRSFASGVSNTNVILKDQDRLKPTPIGTIGF